MKKNKSSKSTVNSQPVKKAFCLGINQYEESIWGKDANLKGCLNDRDFWTGVLKEQGFDVTVLPEETTVKNFDDLIKSLKDLTGLVVITYSGHGTFYDRPVGKTSERMTGICLKDDVYWDLQYRQALASLSENLKIIWISDSCFSEDNFKGISGSIASSFDSKPRMTIMPKSMVGRAEKVADKARKPSLKCSIIAFSAANKWQPGWDVYFDGLKQGAFTGCFKRKYLENKNRSYFEFWKEVVSEIKKQGFKQNPQLQSICKKGCDPKQEILKPFLT